MDGTFRKRWPCNHGLICLVTGKFPWTDFSGTFPFQKQKVWRESEEYNQKTHTEVGFLWQWSSHLSKVCQHVLDKNGCETENIFIQSGTDGISSTGDPDFVQQNKKCSLWIVLQCAFIYLMRIYWIFDLFKKPFAWAREGIKDVKE
jgi:hypothetical protein